MSTRGVLVMDMQLRVQGSIFKLLATIVVLGISSAYAPKAANPAGLCDPDPEHIWNRVYRQFYVRVAQNGQEFGYDTLDPLLWEQTEFLFQPATYTQTLA